MKKLFTLAISLIVTLSAFAQTEEAYLKQLDSIEKTLKYEHGTIQLANGIGTLKVPSGFKYLNGAQAEKILVDVWGNPKSESPSLGMILPDAKGVTSLNSYVFNIEYEEMGYVKDDDANDIDYQELLTQMKEDSKTENEERKKAGYEPIAIVGWAATPFYDKERKILHWAKNLKFGKDPVNTLNYNIRILGRKGVLVLNAISTMNELPLVKKDISKVLDIVQFNDGFKYDQFDASIDEVAAWSLGGLVAGKVLAKAGILAVFLKFWKILAVAVIALFAKFKNLIFRKKEEVIPQVVENNEDTDEADKNL
ncbi:DUF2167 domain-containing protein [Flavobacterium sp. H122]|uniref:DUF2167 domain-containing protein n=1 Tax=Flavobacterium sp. H122 TaxID=2529860 RepID=UPI0010AAB2E2|nr:DUF2167 domain-containing protein [Flavobacterium sp. H122]